MASNNNTNKKNIGTRATKENTGSQIPTTPTNATPNETPVSPIKYVNIADYDKMMDQMMTITEQMSAVISSIQKTINGMDLVIKDMHANAVPNNPTAVMKMDDLVSQIAGATADKVYSMLDESGVLNCCGCCDDEEDDVDEYDPYDYFDNDGDDEPDDSEDDNDECMGCSKSCGFIPGRIHQLPYIPRSYRSWAPTDVPAAPAPAPAFPSNGTVFNNCTFEGDVYIQRDDNSKTKTEPIGFARLRYPVKPEMGTPVAHPIDHAYDDDTAECLYDALNRLFNHDDSDEKETEG